MEMLRTDLESVMPAGGSIAGNFEGSMNQADFFTTADSPEHVVGNGEIKEVTLCLVTRPESSGLTLVRQILRNPSLSTITPNADEEVLCRNVSGLWFRYYDGSSWQQTWDSTVYNNAVPAAVEVTMQFSRNQSNGQAQTYNFVRVFPLPMSTTTAGSNGINTGGASGFGF